MRDWIDRLTKAEAQKILDAPVKTRLEGRDARGQRVTRYSGPTMGEMARIKAIAEAEPEADG